MTLSSHRIADIRRVRVELRIYIIDLVAPFTRAGLLLVFLHDFEVMRVDDDGDFNIRNLINFYAPFARFKNQIGLIIFGPIVVNDDIRVSNLTQLIAAA